MREKTKQISKKHIRAAMSVIIEKDCTKRSGFFMTKNVLNNCKALKGIDLVALLDTMASMGLIEYRYEKPLAEKAIFLTDSGKHYFIDEQEKRNQRRYELLLAIIPTLLGALLSDPLWKFIHWVKALLLG